MMEDKKWLVVLLVVLRDPAVRRAAGALFGAVSLAAAAALGLGAL